MNLYGELPQLDKAIANAKRRLGSPVELIEGYTVRTNLRGSNKYGVREYGVLSAGEWAGTIRLDSRGKCHANPYCPRIHFFATERTTQ